MMEGAFKAKLAGAAHPILCANLFHKSGERVLLENLILEVSRVKIGIFGVSVAMVTEQMKSKAVSAFLWH